MTIVPMTLKARQCRADDTDFAYGNRSPTLNSTVSGQNCRPVIFNAPMVRAILDGRKTQTRRVIKGWQPDGETVMHFNYGKAESLRCPYGQPGDRLWVRETLWQHNNFGFPLGESPQLQSGIGERVWSYAADIIDADSKTGTVPSIRMPRWASRITLEIRGVRVERLQDISEEDALAEGMSRWHKTRQGSVPRNARDNFKLLWDSINGVGAWDKNEWVWVISFCRVGNAVGNTDGVSSPKSFPMLPAQREKEQA